jgi:Cu/Ag efflux protein CusF
MRVSFARMVSSWAGIGLLALTLSGCARSAPAPPKEAGAKYPLRGQILRLDTTHRTATIKHERIEGWMEAMTMEFPVEPSEFGRLHAGDRIRATVFVKDLDFWIGDIHQEIGP